MAIAVGTLSVWIGAVIGSVAAMVLGRYVVRDLVKQKIQKFKVFDAIDRVITKQVSNVFIIFRVSSLLLCFAFPH